MDGLYLFDFSENFLRDNVNIKRNKEEKSSTTNRFNIMYRKYKTENNLKPCECLKIQISKFQKKKKCSTFL